jgi:hypothetical protein
MLPHEAGELGFEQRELAFITASCLMQTEQVTRSEANELDPPWPKVRYLEPTRRHKIKLSPTPRRDRLMIRVADDRKLYRAIIVRIRRFKERHLFANLRKLFPK